MQHQSSSRRSSGRARPSWAASAVLALLVALTTLIAPGLAPTASAADPDLGTLSGTVTNPNNTPVSGVQVAVRHQEANGGDSGEAWVEVAYPGGARPTTNAAGEWELEVEPGTYRIEFVASGYADHFYPEAYSIGKASNVTVTAGGSVDNLNAKLRVEGGMRGKVTDDEGVAVKDVVVKVQKVGAQADDGTHEWTTVATATTDVNGAWSLYVAPGTYRIAFEASDYLPRFWPATYDIEDGSDVTVQSGVNGTYDTVLDGQVGILQGTVTGQVGQDAQIAVYQEQTFKPQGVDQTRWIQYDSTYLVDGIYQLVLPAGDYRIAYFDDDSAPYFHPGVTGLDQATNVTVPDQAVETVNMALPATSPASGNVTLYGLHAPNVVVTAFARYVDDIRDGIPHYGVAVLKPGAAQTAPDGSYTINLRPGTYYLRYDLSKDQVDYTKYYLSGTELAEAQVVTVKAAEGVDLADVEMADLSAPTDQVTNLLRPTISGAAASGQKLTVDPGVWVPNSASLVVQWLRNGVAIEGANELTYTLVNDDRSQKISARVFGSYSGLLSGAATSREVTVLKDCGFLGLGCLPAPPPTPTSPTNSEKPVITGTPAVGSPLSASTGTWSAADDYLYQWYVADAIVYGANGATYTPRRTDAGKNVSVKVYATAAGLTGTATSAAVGPVAQAPVLNVQRPTIVGNPIVGETLSTDGGLWLPTDVTLAYQWFADGEPIPAATSKSFDLNQDQIDKDIWVQVTATRTGYDTADALSPVTGPVTPKGPVDPEDEPFENTALPTIVNTTIASTAPRVGDKLVATNGAWTPTPTAYDYQWFFKLGSATGPIEGATAPSFTVTDLQRGSEIQVRVTAKGDGSVDTSATSAWTLPVQQATPGTPGSTVKAQPAVAVQVKVKKNGKVVVKATVAATGVPVVTGQVRIKVSRGGGKAVLVTLTNGKAKLVLTKLRKGKHKAKVTYLGSTTVAASSKAVQKFKK